MSYPHIAYPAPGELESGPGTSRGPLRLVRAGGPRAALREVCREMVADIEREIVAARKDVAARAFPITHCVCERHEQPYWIHRLTLATRVPSLRGDDPVLLRNAGNEVPALVLSARGHEVWVATTKAIPHAGLSGGQLVIDPTWLLERLRDGVQDVHDERDASVSATTFDAELALLAVGAGDLAYNTVLSTYEPPADLTDRLNEEQQAALRASFTRRILCLWGPPGTGKTTVTLATIVDAHLRAGHRILVLAPSNAATDVVASALARQLERAPGFDAGLVLRAGARPTEELRRRYGAQLLPHLVAARLANDAYAPSRDGMSTESRELDSLHGRLPTSARARVHLDRERGAIREVLSRLADGEEASRQRRYEQLLDDCRVLVAPIHHVYLSRQIRGEFDVVIVDEASMVSGPQLLLAACRARRHVVIAGDFLQLPAPVQNPQPTRVPWLATDPFQRLGIPQAVAREEDADHLVMLREQYRMAGPICDLVSAQFYGGRLRSAPAIRQRPTPPWAISSASLVLLDTSPLRPRATVPPGTHSRVNAVHMEVMGRLVASLDDRSCGPALGSLLILSAFTEQVRQLCESLRPIGRSRESLLRISTVHRAQGSEADTVVLCLDDAAGAPPSEFIRAHDLTGIGARLINVGFSRARGRLVLVADVGHLARVGGRVVQRLLGEMQERAYVLAPDDI